MFIIRNINKFLYEVKIESSQSEFYSESPSVFSSIFKREEKVESFIQKEANQVLGNEIKKPDIEESVKTYGLNEISLQRNQMMLASISEDRNTLKILPASQQNRNRIQELDRKIEKLNLEIESQRETIKELRKKIDDEFSKQTADLYVLAENVNEAFIRLEESKTVKNKLVDLSLTDGLNYSEALISINTIKNEYPFILKPGKLLDSYYQRYRRFKTAERLYIVNEAVLSHFDDDPQKAKNSIIYLSEEIENIKKKVDDYKYGDLFQSELI